MRLSQLSFLNTSRQLHSINAIIIEPYKRSLHCYDWITVIFQQEALYRKIATILRGINPYINALKTMSDRLAMTPNLRGYKLLHENPRHHDLRIYNQGYQAGIATGNMRR